MTNANGVDTPLTTEITQFSNNRSLMNTSDANKYRRAVAISATAFKYNIVAKRK